ncbi:MAG: DUF5615 family PIN-like protein [Candidatus Eremiobacterota bacterium]
MKFLLNMNVPLAVGKKLVFMGHTYRHVRDIGKSKASDIEIIREARINGEIIITHDLDYGHLLAFSGDREPSVIIFRLRNSHPDNLCNKLISVWPDIEKSLIEGAIILMEDTASRIRKLPVAKENL